MHNRCVIPLPSLLHRSRDRTSGSGFLIQKEIAEPPASPVTLLRAPRQKDISPTAGLAARSPGSVLHPWPLHLLSKCHIWVLAVWVCIQDQPSSSHPTLPPLVAGASVGAWTTISDLSPGSGPIPRCCCRLTAHSTQRPSQPTCAHELFIFQNQPLLLQTCFPVSRHRCSHSSSLSSALHRHFALVLSLAVTPVVSTSPVHVASHHSDSFRPH